MLAGHKLHLCNLLWVVKLVNISLADDQQERRESVTWMCAIALWALCINTLNVTLVCNRNCPDLVPLTIIGCISVLLRTSEANH